MQVIKFFKIFTMIFIFNILYAQTTISGKITDENASPLHYADIVLIGTNYGSSTDEDGFYLINLPESFVQGQKITLSAQFIGYIKAEQSIVLSSGEITENFTLEADIIGMDQVVVTGLGISKEKKALGYSVQDVSAEELNMVPQTNIADALSGKVAGVQVLGSAGAAIGGSAKIRLRGANGLTDAQPLWVIDGTPIDNRSFSGAYDGRDYGNLANDINMYDVESISVLKGASASALYGTRAANGVILVTTKKGGSNKDGIGFSYSSTSSYDDILILPEYQNEYAGGYTQSWLTEIDPEDGLEYNVLNYAADESWGPKMDGTIYRPWWSWIHDDFDGDGVDDYGTQIALEAQPDNVKNFLNQGINQIHNFALDGGNDISSFRLSFKIEDGKGVIPNSKLNKSALGFNGSLDLTGKISSSVSFNYANTQGFGRPASGYSPLVGNPVQSFNQWFQRQLDMDKLKKYKAEDGSIYSWNLRSATNLRPLYWDSPYFSYFENISEDERNRLYGNFSLIYKATSNLSLAGAVRSDQYDFLVEDRIASGGLEQDWYSMAKRSQNEMNYEVTANYNQNLGFLTFSGLIGGNIMNRVYSSNISQTSGGLSLPGYYNIDASVDRPSVTTFTEEKEIRSAFGSATFNFGGIYYFDATLRNDISSSLPSSNNSYNYYSLSNSFVFTSLFNIPFISFGKIRASVAQVGSDTDPYNVGLTYSVGTPYGSNATLAVPNTLPNPDLKPSINSDTEFGIDVRFLNNLLRLDITSYTQEKKDDIIPLTVPGASGYSTTLVNAGKFTTTGTEYLIGFNPIRTKDIDLDFTLNYATSESQVDELAEGMEARQLFRAYWGTFLFAKVGEEWGAIKGAGYQQHENGERIITDGNYITENNKWLGYVLPDATGGFRIDAKFKGLSLGAFFDFQVGGQFYSLTRQWGTYSGMTSNTIGNNELGNPVRDPVLTSDGTEVTWIDYDDAASNSGGVLLEGVDEEGNSVKVLRDAVSVAANSYYKRSEENLLDASYARFREFRVGYDIPSSILENLPLSNLNLAVSIRNVAMLSSAETGIDPTTASNGHGDGYSYWEGGVLPSTRTVSFNINVKF